MSNSRKSTGTSILSNSVQNASVTKFCRNFPERTRQLFLGPQNAFACLNKCVSDKGGQFQGTKIAWAVPVFIKLTKMQQVDMDVENRVGCI
jgi:hypothetical protein